jgi:prepilin-type N-terminal cleavage/methylation domain-containing protein
MSLRFAISFVASHAKTKVQQGFTLIELLIVVLIIAILSAIAIPNFLEAQTRAKVTRAKADMRSAALAIEAYSVDHGSYMPAHRSTPPGTIPYGLAILTCPIAYLSQRTLEDPFFKTSPGEAKGGLLIWNLLDANHVIIEAVSATQDGPPLTSYLPGVYWMLWSRGPDRSSGFSRFDAEFLISQRITQAETDLGPFCETLYDPTNGTISTGNIYRVGGSQWGRAAQLIERFD